MKVLITGCAGFIGFHLSNKLIKLKCKVYGIDNLNNYYDVNIKKNRLKILKQNQNFFFNKIDLVDKIKLFKFLRKHKFKYVINLAAQAGVRYSLENPMSYVNNNIIAFLNLVEFFRIQKPDHFITASTSSCYGASTKFPLTENNPSNEPLQLYAVTKKTNELNAHAYSHLFNIPITAVRLFTVYGPWGRPDMSLFKFTKNILENKKIEVFNKGNHVRDFTYIDDVVDALCKLLNKKPKKVKYSNAKYQVVNIGGSSPIKLKNFIKEIEIQLGKKSKKKLLRLQPGDIIKTSANPKKLEELINFKPKIGYKQGIKEFIRWYVNYYR